jgi:phage-related holin
MGIVKHVPVVVVVVVVVDMLDCSVDTHHCSVDTVELFHDYFFYFSAERPFSQIPLSHFEHIVDIAEALLNTSNSFNCSDQNDENVCSVAIYILQ